MGADIQDMFVKYRCVSASCEDCAQTISKGT